MRIIDSYLQQFSETAFKLWFMIKRLKVVVSGRLVVWFQCNGAFTELPKIIWGNHR